MESVIRRGDLVKVALAGDYGKPRPALVIQSDLFAKHPSITLCLLTTALQDAPLMRLLVDPSSENGLQQRSQIQIDKIVTIPRPKALGPIGHLDDSIMLEVNRALALWLGMA